MLCTLTPVAVRLSRICHDCFVQAFNCHLCFAHMLLPTSTPQSPCPSPHQMPHLADKKHNAPCPLTYMMTASHALKGA